MKVMAGMFALNVVLSGICVALSLAAGNVSLAVAHVSSACGWAFAYSLAIGEAQ